MDVIRATDPRQVAIFREIRLQWRKELANAKFFAEGEQVLFRLLQSRLEILSMLITPEHFEQWSNLIASQKNSNVTIWIAEKKWMEENTHRKLNQGCLAIGRIPAAPQLPALLSAGPCHFVALDGLDHAVNVGAIVRNCAAFGVSAIFVDRTTMHPYSWRSITTSMGGVFYVPVLTVDSLSNFLPALRQHGIELIAAHPEGTMSIANIDFSKHCCLLFGNEHRGISNHLLDLTSRRVSIPCSGNMDSLNVAAASAILLHHAYSVKAFLL